MLFLELAKKAIRQNYKILSANSFFQIKDVVLNDKIAKRETVFVAIKGFKNDGHNFLINAYNNGCRDFVVEYIPENFLSFLRNITLVKVNDSRLALAEVSNGLFDYPSDKLKIVGITGTKGKTTVSTLLYEFLSQVFNTSLFTTVKNIIADKEEYSERTTLESNELQKLLAESVKEKDTHSVVEVSSHGVTLKRVALINWDAGIFTSFSQDHLDLYGTMENYFQAKLDFFRSLNKSNKKEKFAVVNIDDPKGEEVISVLNSTVKPIMVGTKEKSDYRIKDVFTDYTGIKFKLQKGKNEYPINSKMRGLFNITNIALAAIAALELGVDFSYIEKVLSTFPGVEGRFEIIKEKPFFVIIDYAHTPDSLKKILIEARKLTNKRVILVFGCPGERDKEKRAIMGTIAAELANYSIITNDDTYEEDEKEIIKQIEKGFLIKNKVKDKDYKIIYDRKEAIQDALSMGKDNDVIVIAGMGHQKVQHLRNGVIPHSDKEIVIKFFEKK